jgi:hypothetical protein
VIGDHFIDHSAKHPLHEFRLQPAFLRQRSEPQGLLSLAIGIGIGIDSVPPCSRFERSDTVRGNKPLAQQVDDLRIKTVNIRTKRFEVSVLHGWMVLRSSTAQQPAFA